MDKPGINRLFTMWLSLTGIKVSIAGARLTHLVQKDKVWDHGSMVEQVKTIFFQLEKARHRSDDTLIKKYLTVAGRRMLQHQLEEIQAVPLEQRKKNACLTEVCILGVMPGNVSRPDQFKALLTGTNTSGQQTVGFRERWLMVRQGDWWLLDKILSKIDSP